MNKDFIIIAVTSPVFFQGESDLIVSLLKKGKADFVHIRKPDASVYMIRHLLENIDHDLYPRLKLHDHFELLEVFDLGGCHLNSRNPVAPVGVKSISKSIHSLEEIEDNDTLDYVFLSPVFDSISKPGYRPTINLAEINEKIKGKNVIALGGVTPDKFHLLKFLGFRGAALLGHFFPSSHG